MTGDELREYLLQVVNEIDDASLETIASWPSLKVGKWDIERTKENAARDVFYALANYDFKKLSPKRR